MAVTESYAPIAGRLLNSEAMPLETVGAFTIQVKPNQVEAWRFAATGELVQVAAAAFIELIERAADPAAPAANGCRLYAIDSAGKTRFAARFATGAVQAIATEP